jgi:hypothetical protein
MFEVCSIPNFLPEAGQQDRYGRRIRAPDGSLSGVFSLAHRATWAAGIGDGGMTYEELGNELYEDIPIPLECLMMSLEVSLSGDGFEYFHPNEFEIVARQVDTGLCIVLTAFYVADHGLSLEVKMASPRLDEFNRTLMDISSNLDGWIKKMKHVEEEQSINV